MPAVPYRKAVFCNELFGINEILAGLVLGLHPPDYRSEGKFPLLTDGSRVTSIRLWGAPCAVSGRVRKEKVTERPEKVFVFGVSP
jgi:hypothetical protein